MKVQKYKMEITDLGYYSVLNKPTEQELTEYYSEKYYQEAKGSYELEYSDEEILYIKNKLKERNHIVSNNITTSNRKFLDIGCGEGWALAYFHNEGWGVKGLDFSDFGCKKMNKDCVPFLQVGDIYKNLNKIINSDEKFGMVWLANVLEHVIDPVGLINMLYRILDKGGILVIEVPNDFSVLQKFLFQQNKVNREFWVTLPDHLSYFNKDSLNNLMISNNYFCVDFIGDYPIDINLLNENSNYINNPTIGKSCHKERIDFTNLIHSQSIEDVISYHRALAGLGLGRDITGFYTVK